MREYQRRDHDEQLASGSIVYWSRRTGTDVAVKCGLCGKQLGICLSDFCLELSLNCSGQLCGILNDSLLIPKSQYCQECFLRELDGT